jgi:hypothetical protein
MLCHYAMYASLVLLRAIYVAHLILLHYTTIRT